MAKEIARRWVSPIQGWADDAFTQSAAEPARPPFAEGAANFADGSIETIATRLDLDAEASIEGRKALDATETRRANRFRSSRDRKCFIVQR